jgi:hypothetical protein
MPACLEGTLVKSAQLGGHPWGLGALHSSWLSSTHPHNKRILAKVGGQAGASANVIMLQLVIRAQVEHVCRC